VTDLFLQIFNRSISAGWVVLAVLLLRPLLFRAPKWTRMLLWGIVAARLLLPFAPESPISLIPAAQTVAPEIMMAQDPVIDSGVPVINEILNPVIGQVFSPEHTYSANPLQIWIPVAGQFWLLGILVMAVYAAVSYLRLRRRVSTAVRLRDNIFRCDRIDTPFVLGLLRPRIYLPWALDDTTAHHVIRHEQCHLRRLDPWWKALGFGLLAFHWFHPLLWLGYILLCRDIELACDEKAVRDLAAPEKADYSQALLSCSVRKVRFSVCPLAFGEVGIAQRIRSVLHYKKPTLWVLILAVILCSVAAVCFLTDPVTPADTGELLLSVKIEDNDSTQDAPPRWEYLPVVPAENALLPGSNPVYISLSDITDSSLRLRFSTPMVAENSHVAELVLTRGRPVSVVTPTPGGSTRYTFAIVDRSAAADPITAELTDLLQTITGKPLQASDPGSYIRMHPAEYAKFTGYGAQTLRYCFSRFLSGGQTDLKGHIMAIACEDIMATWGESYDIAPGQRMTGQQWFDSFRTQACILLHGNSIRTLRSTHPGAALLLTMQTQTAAGTDRLAPGFYREAECVYMSPLSSYMPDPSATDFFCAVTQDQFIFGSAVWDVDYRWQTLESSSGALKAIRDTWLYEILQPGTLYQPLSDRHCLFLSGDQLYFAMLGSGRSDLEIFWCIYRLEPDA